MKIYRIKTELHIPHDEACPIDEEFHINREKAESRLAEMMTAVTQTRRADDPDLAGEWKKWESSDESETNYSNGRYYAEIKTIEVIE